MIMLLGREMSCNTNIHRQDKKLIREKITDKCTGIVLPLLKIFYSSHRHVSAGIAETCRCKK
jgi:hypothetical protein